MVRKTNFVKLYKIMYKLTAISYRRALSQIVPNIKDYSDNQVFELMHAVNTHVDIQGICDPTISDKKMREIRLSREFGKTLANTKNSNKDNRIDEREFVIGRV